MKLWDLLRKYYWKYDIMMIMSLSDNLIVGWCIDVLSVYFRSLWSKCVNFLQRQRCDGRKMSRWDPFSHLGHRRRPSGKPCRLQKSSDGSDGTCFQIILHTCSVVVIYSIVKICKARHFPIHVVYDWYVICSQHPDLHWLPAEKPVISCHFPLLRSSRLLQVRPNPIDSSRACCQNPGKAPPT